MKNVEVRSNLFFIVNSVECFDGPFADRTHKIAADCCFMTVTVVSQFGRRFLSAWSSLIAENVERRTHFLLRDCLLVSSWIIFSGLPNITLNRTSDTILSTDFRFLPSSVHQVNYTAIVPVTVGHPPSDQSDLLDRINAALNNQSLAFILKPTQLTLLVPQIPEKTPPAPLNSSSIERLVWKNGTSVKSENVSLDVFKTQLLQAAESLFGLIGNRSLQNATNEADRHVVPFSNQSNVSGSVFVRYNNETEKSYAVNTIRSLWKNLYG